MFLDKKNNRYGVNKDVIGLYPGIPRKEEILALKSKSKEQTSKIPTYDLVKLVEFVLKKLFLNLTRKLSNRSLARMEKTETNFF